MIRMPPQRPAPPESHPRRTTYTFQLSLNDTKQGVQVWEDEEEIGKQGTRAAVGF